MVTPLRGHDLTLMRTRADEVARPREDDRAPQQIGSPVAPLFSTSAFLDPRAAPVAGVGSPQGAAPYFPTMSELNRPTPAFVVNITNGDRQPLNQLQMSTEQGADFIRGRLASLGYSGPGQVGNTTAPTAGPFRIDYNGDDRRHLDIDGMNVGLAQQWYAMFGPEVADRMLAADMKYARRTSWDGDEGPSIPAQLTAFDPSAQPQQQPPAAVRLLPGTNAASQFQQVALSTTSASSQGYRPTLAELNRPTSAASVNVTTGDRTPLNPAQMSDEQGLAFVRERLAALGYSGPGVVSNQTAPTVGPFGIDYGNDSRRHWDIDGMNVGLTLQLYATNSRETADRMLGDLLRNQMPR